jgi:dolichol-phosphate mannosyltransferase
MVVLAFAPTQTEAMAKAIACIVLPTFNEAENISVLLPRIFSQASAISTHELHVLVVDDSSPDGTAYRVSEAMQHYPHLHLISGKRRGLGDAYKRGIAHAIETFRPHLIVQMDADLQHDPALLSQMIGLANDGYDLVIGSRFASGGSIPSFSAYRKLISLAGIRLVRRFAGIPHIHDCTSGYRAIKAEMITRCDLKRLSTRGYSFQSSLLCELLWNGARIKEIPIVFGQRSHGDSKLSLRDQWEFVVNLFRLRFCRPARKPSRTSESSLRPNLAAGETESERHRPSPDASGLAPTQV